MTEEQFLIPISIAIKDSVYRHAHLNNLIPTQDKKFRIPRPSHFKPDHDGLSVNLDRLITINGVYHIIGLSYKIGKPQYKDPKEFKLFRIPVQFIRSMEGIIDVIHTPIFRGNPAPIGFPNNYAHTSLLYPDDEEIRLKLSDYCWKNYDTCHCAVDFTFIELEVMKLREKLNSSIYHCLPTDPKN
jgi:hypothetical protein